MGVFVGDLVEVFVGAEVGVDVFVGDLVEVFVGTEVYVAVDVFVEVGALTPAAKEFTFCVGVGVSVLVEVEAFAPPATG